MEKELLQLRAQCILQAAEILSLLSIVAAADPSATDRFLSGRRHFVQLQLEKIEKTDPALAAQLSGILDAHCRQFPLDYQ